MKSECAEFTASWI